MASRPVTIAVASLALAVGAADCEADLLACSPTKTRAEDARVTEAGLGELRASLRSGDVPIRGRSLNFEVRAGDTTLLSASVRVTADGSATLAGSELSEARRRRLPEADGFVARFVGDDAYCDSADTAAVTVVQP